MAIAVAEHHFIHVHHHCHRNFIDQESIHCVLKIKKPLRICKGLGIIFIYSLNYNHKQALRKSIHIILICIML